MDRPSPPDGVRIRRRRHRQRSNRTGAVVVVWLVIPGLAIVGLTIEDRIPGVAEVRRLPDSAVVRRHVEDIRLAGNSGDRHGAAAAERADHAPVKFLVHRRVILLGGKRERKKQNTERGEQNPEECLFTVGPRRRGKDKPRRRGVDRPCPVRAERNRYRTSWVPSGLCFSLPNNRTL